MSDNKFPIGTDLTVDQDYELKGFNDDITQVRKGDRILVTRTGLLYLTGDARGDYTISENLIDKTQYDVQNISFRVVESIISSLGDDFKNFIEERGITKEELIETVYEELDYFI
ncbi:hypothetical protein [Clostridium perfringens]|jgi:hypothetical protein|uniref:Uncharacterized protein n=1 Tax=Clostridium perfringens TaxID=1502 RepID=A0AAW4J443_CLOPF|nr:hypothetical protein [Clostridium perfringens]MBO3356216.1 hypothetical protein [Clostridium perfringens]MBO3359443.1 hypothetical protein [Clostridium perfringens]